MNQTVNFAVSVLLQLAKEYKNGERPDLNFETEYKTTTWKHYSYQKQAGIWITIPKSWIETVLPEYTNTYPFSFSYIRQYFSSISTNFDRAAEYAFTKDKLMLRVSNVN